MNRTTIILLNWISLFAVITVNVLAVILPINGQSTKEISDLYPNLFVPAGFTFSIWSVIYAMLIMHTIYSTYMLSTQQRANTAVGKLVQKVNPWYWVTTVFNCCWILAWHYLQPGLSVVIMIGLYGSLLAIFRIISISEKTLDLKYKEHVCVETPFIFYTSWITVALVADITAWLISMGWHGGPLPEWAWSCLMIGVASAIGVWMSLYWHRPAFTAVIVWALIGIYVAQHEVSAYIGYAAMAGGVLCLLSAAIGFWKKRKLLFGQ